MQYQYNVCNKSAYYVGYVTVAPVTSTALRGNLIVSLLVLNNAINLLKKTL